MTRVRAASVSVTVALLTASALLTACASDDTRSAPTATNSSPTKGGSVTPSQSVDQVAQSVVGMTEAQAAATITSAGYVSRVVERDGKHLPVTMDLREDRINLAIKDGTVTKATVG